MRLLCTGFHPAAAGPNRRRIDYITHFDWLKDILTDMGHTLDWRTVKVGEDLRGQYDGAVLSCVKMASLPALSWRYSALWAASQLPTLWHFDDWAIMQVWQAFQPKYLWRDLGGFAKGTCGKQQEEGRAQQAALDPVVERLYRGFATGIVMAWEGGNHALLRKYLRCSLFTVDPTAYYRPYEGATVLDPTEKVRRWSSASIANISAWLQTLKLQWPLQHVGQTESLHMKGGRTPRFERWPERDVVVKAYRAAWGALAQAYPHAGSGWWRQRYYHAADVGTVSYASTTEMGFLGRTWNARTPAAIEGLNDAGLQMLAVDQRESLYANAPSRAAVKQRVADALETAGIR